MTLHVSVPVLSLNIWDTCDAHNGSARVSDLVLAYGEQANTVSCLSTLLVNNRFPLSSWWTHVVEAEAGGLRVGWI